MQVVTDERVSALNPKILAKEYGVWAHTYERWKEYGRAAEIWALRWKRKTEEAFNGAKSYEEMKVFYDIARKARIKNALQRLSPEQKGMPYILECSFYLDLEFRFNEVVREKWFIGPHLWGGEKNPIPDGWWESAEEEARGINPLARRNIYALAHTWAQNWKIKTITTFDNADSKKELDIAFRLVQSAKFAYASLWLGSDTERLEKYYTWCDKRFNLEMEYLRCAKRKGFAVGQ